MRTKQIKLTEIQKDSLGLIYYAAKNGLELCETLMKDKNLDGYVRYTFIRMWEMAFRKVKTQLDKSLGCNENFDDQIKNSDTQGLAEVIKGYIAMSPEGREAVEQLFEAIKNNEEIKVEVV